MPQEDTEMRRINMDRCRYLGEENYPCSFIQFSAKAMRGSGHTSKRSPTYLFNSFFVAKKHEDSEMPTCMGGVQVLCSFGDLQECF